MTHRKHTRTILGALLLILIWGALLAARAFGQQAPPDPLVAAIAEAMATEVAVGPRGAPVAHCRNAGPALDTSDPWARCRRRLRAFAGMFVDVGARHSIDPWLLAAIARKESAFSPFARGASHREGGIMQLHPGNRRNRAVPFLRSEAYAHSCRDVVGACQLEVVERAAAILVAARARCRDEREAVNAYNLGARCDRTWRYAAQVYAIRARMMGGAP